jgi:hypothetical protein
MGRTACREPQCLYKGDLYLYFMLTTGMHITKKVKVKVMFTLEQATKAKRESRGIAVLFL